MSCEMFNIHMFFLVFSIWGVNIYAQSTSELDETTITPCNNSSDNSCEAFNSTEISSTVLVKTTSTTTKKPKTTTTTTAKPVTTKAPGVATNFSKPMKPHADCSCDHTNGSCEVNCCCDVDCSIGQRSTFTHCVYIPEVVDTDQCYPTDLVYQNNTDHRAVMTEPGVLCVVQENTFAATGFTDVPVIKTIAALEKKLGRKKYYSWPNPNQMYPVFSAETSYTKQSPIWVVINSSITLLDIPSQVGMSTVCHGGVVPRYLEEMSSWCTKPLQSEDDCSALSTPQFTVISSFTSYNFTEPQECTEDVCLPVVSYICTKGCIKGNVSLPVFNKTSNMCFNVVSSVEYQIIHNGSHGPVEVRAYYKMKDIDVGRGWVRREHKVTYRWAGIADRGVLQRSGRPGYQRGRPIISGQRTAKGVTFNLTAADWISVGVSDSSVHCGSRTSLVFGENIRTQCLLAVGGSCKQTQQQIWKQLLGPVANLSSSVISSYGDPRVGEEESESWVPLLTGESPPPPALVTGVDLVIMYSLVGSKARPQAKIIAVYINQLSPPLSCEANHSVVSLETSVKFIDKTRHAVTKFAEPPVYEIKLPQDFFYPFLSHGNRENIAIETYFLIAFTIFLYQ